MWPVVILCGGQGSRLRGRFPDLPKALVPVAGRPFLEHQLRWLMAAGARQVHLAAGYRSEALLEWLHSYAEATHRGLTLTISVEPRPLDTAGALRYAADAFAPQTPAIIVVNGDTLVPELDFLTLENVGIEFSKVWKKWRLRFPNLGKEAKPDFQTLETPGAVIATVLVEDAGRFGTVELTAHGLVASFAEKRVGAGAGWVNAGIYWLDMRLIRSWPPDCALSMEQDVLPALAKAGLLAAVRASPPLLDIGTPQGLDETERFLVSGSFAKRAGCTGKGETGS